jgi:hypothetical protein
MEFQVHEISLSAGQPVMTLCRKPPIMKLAVVADPETDVSFGSWPCENAKTLNRDRRSYSSKTALVGQGASGLNLEVGLENIILRCVSIFEFLHGQGQKATFGWSAPLMVDSFRRRF